MGEMHAGSIGFLVLLTLLNTSLLGCRTKPEASKTPPMRKEQAQALLTSIAEQWLPVAGSDAHTVGGFSPTNAAPSLYAVSYGTKKALPAVWNFYAAKLGVTNLYRENQTFVLGGQNERGNFALVERSAGVLRDDTIFCLRTPEFTVSATFKPGSGDWQTVGNVVVALEQAASAKALAR